MAGIPISAGSLSTLSNKPVKVASAPGVSGNQLKASNPVAPKQVLGSSTSNVGPGGAYPIAGGRPTIVGGGSSPVAAPQPTGGGAPQIPMPQQPSIDFDALIKPALDALDSAISPLQQDEANQETGIQQNKQTALDTANQSITQQTGTINRAQTQQTQNEQSASDAARRQYAEIQQGLQARYGGTTGTGEFATEQAGTQTLRSLSDIKTAAANAQADLSDKLQQVQAVGATLLKQINDQADQQISSAKANLNSQLADIRNQKATLLGNKAQMAASAIQSYQQTVNQVQTANAQFAQQLYAQQQAAQQSLQAGLSKANAITSAATPEELTQIAQQIKQLGSSGVNATTTQKFGNSSITLSAPDVNNTNNLINPFATPAQ